VELQGSDQDNEFSGSFLTHANYLRAFSMLCRAPYTPKALLEVPQWTRDLPALKRAMDAIDRLDAPGLPRPVADEVENSLRNGWGTELMLVLSGTIGAEDELLRLMNNWAVVQSYYCCYHALQGLLAARGEIRPEDHARTQGQFVSLWITPKLALPPWSFGAGPQGWCNLLDEAEVDDTISTWRTPDRFTCWSLAGKALRTSRDLRVVERQRAAREGKRKANKKQFEAEEEQRLSEGKRRRKAPVLSLPRLTAEEKRAAEGKVRAYSLMDYLYRLRIKTNYEEPRMFTLGPKDRDASLFVYGAIVAITECTMLAHELRVQRLVGQKTLLTWVDSWLARSASAAEGLGLSRRRDLLAG
jgi:hypothetical protein